jgi:hypothetical protein
MKNLGKVLLLFLLPLSLLQARVSLEVSETTITQGEPLYITLRVAGKKFSMPDLQLIGGVKIDGNPSKSSSTTIINGTISSENTYTYTISPQKSMVIEPIKIIVDGKEEQTKAIAITVTKPQATVGGPYYVTLETDKKEVYVGEPFTVKMRYFERMDLDIIDHAYTSPGREHFWVKELGKVQGEVKEPYQITKLDYRYSPQKSGELTIEPVKMRVAFRSYRRDSWGFPIQSAQWKTVFSNELKIHVKPLPDGVNLVGNITINSSVDKLSTQHNEPVNLAITIEGEGNLEDISELPLTIDKAQLFNEKPTLTHTKNITTYTQKIAIIADQDYTIPSFSLTYLDLKTKQVKTITTQPIPITVKGAPKKPTQTVLETAKPEQPITKTAPTPLPSLILLAITSLASVLIGFILGRVLPLQWWKREKKEEAKLSKDDKQTLLFLLPLLGKNANIDHAIAQLAENVYEGKKHVVDRKKLKTWLEEVVE